MKPHPAAVRVGDHWVWFEVYDDTYGAVVKGYVDGKVEYTNSTSRFRYSVSDGQRWKKRKTEELSGRKKAGLKSQYLVKDRIMYQKLIVAGNLGKDPEMRFAPTGDAVTNLSVATNRKYTDKNGQKVEEVTWFRVSVWGKHAEACNTYLKKGAAVLVEGRLQADKATGGPRIFTRQDGSSGASFEITADTVRFLGGGQHETDKPTETEAANEDLI